ncbi:MAG: DNA repair and recombination protein RadA [archaeon]|nr:DNA repair and recombination protein RadA [archaeon]
MGAAAKIKTVTELPGVGTVAAEKLHAAGYKTLEAIAIASPAELIEIAALGELTAAKVIKAARESLEMGYESADILAERRKLIGKITTGSKELDELIGGGIESQSITEFYGKFASGKTNLCFQLAVTTQLPKDKGGQDGNVLWIDTENSFRPERIIGIAKHLKLDPAKVLKNIFVARAYNSDHQMSLTEKATELVKEKNIKLLVMDSLMAQFRAEFIGRGTLSERQQKLNKHMHALAKLAEINNIAVVVTNQVMQRPDILFGDPTAPVGGDIVGHACLGENTLIQLDDGSIQQIKEVNNSNVMSADLKNSLQIEKQAITFKSSRDDIKEVFEIDTGYKIFASAEHRFFTLNGFEIKEVRAEEIQKGNYLLHAKQMNVNGSIQSIPQKTLTEMVIVNKQGAELIKNSLIQMGITREHASESIGINSRQFRAVLNQSFPTNKGNLMMLVKQGINENLLENLETHTSNKYRDISMPSQFTPELAQITGYLLGDGCIEERSISFRDSREQVLQTYSGLFKQIFNLDGQISKIKNKNCYELSINSKDIKELFEFIKPNAIQLVSRSPNEIVKAFIKGFADAEGYVDKKVRKISIAQKNEELLKTIQLLLLRFEITSEIRNSGKKKFPLLEIYSTDVVKFHELIGLSADDKSKQLEKWAKEFEENKAKEIVPINRKAIWNFLTEVFKYPSKIIQSRNYGFITLRELKDILKALQAKQLTEEQQTKKQFLEKLLNGNIQLLKVKKVTKKQNNSPLFDLSVPATENYVANGFIVHNSKTRLYLRKSKEDKRVAKLVDSPSLPDGEAIFRVTENGIEDAKPEKE